MISNTININELTININNDLIKKLINYKNNKTLISAKYEYINRGGEGVIFAFDGCVIKIYFEYILERIVKEFYTIGLLNQLNFRNVLKVYDY